MKRKTPNLMTATLLSVLFFSACQKDATMLSPQNPADLRISSSRDPIEFGVSIPVAGNSFVTKPAIGGNEAITANGLSNWTNKDAVISTYFYVGKPGDLFVGATASVPSGSSVIKVTVNGQQFTLNTILGGSITGNTPKKYRAGMITITQPGYVKVDLQGVSNTSNGVFANISDILVYGTATVSSLSFANDAANYSASRAGAGVSLYYNTDAQNTEWFYNELTVPSTTDKVGTNYISNGFDGGYAGLQSTLNGEKRIMFFVSNSGIDAVKMVRKGATTVETDINNGKMYYLPFNWVGGTTYKFLTQSKSDGLGNTIYSSWVYTPGDNSWKLIASCSKFNANGNYLTGLYSSLKGTNPENGYFSRKVRCFNQWVNTNGNWIEVTSATFKADAIATNNQRLDCGASAVFSSFNLETQGFFNPYITINSSLSRLSTTSQPSVDLNALP